MQLKRIIPLGSWCRTAYQCRLHAQAFGLQTTYPGPFDWTITPFRALSKIIREDFRQEILLNPVDSYVNRVGSVTCGYTGISFHHDLSPELVSANGGTANDQAVPAELIESDHWINAKRRFIHTLEKMKNIRHEEGNLYVRWMNCGWGRSDGNFPEVFDGETPSKIASLLSVSDSLKSSCLLHVTTEYVASAQQPIVNPIKSINILNENCFQVTLLERLGHNGDQTNNFMGDEYSWNILLSRILLLSASQI